MSEQFSIGEVAIYFRLGAPGHGKEVTITSELKTIDGIDVITKEIRRVDVHSVDMSESLRAELGVLRHETIWCAIENLRKRRPPQELGSWDECVWKPKHLQVTA